MSRTNDRKTKVGQRMSGRGHVANEWH